MQLRGKNFIVLLMSVAFLLAVIGAPLVFAQAPAQQPAPGQDTKQEYDTPYTEEEYNAYQAAANEPDLVKRRQLLLKFMDANPKSALLTYVTPMYQQLMQQSMKTCLEQQKYQELAAVSEEYLMKYPNDLTATAFAAEGYRGTKNYAKFIEFGQKVFAAKPDASTAYYITQAYESMKDSAKFMEWAQKTMDLAPGNTQYHLEFAPKIADHLFDQKQFDKAAAVDSKLIPVIEKATKPAETSDAEWKKYTVSLRTASYFRIAEALYQKDKFQEAVAAFQKVTLLDKKNEVAYFRIGNCHWRLNDPDNAIEAFAKAYVLNGTTSKSSYESLEKLYKSIHNNQTTGINKVIDQAKKEIAG